MAIDLVTGHAGTDHVSSASAGRYNAGVCGPEKYVLETGRKFAATIESANMIRIASGDAVNQGRHITIPQNTYEDAEIITGAQGKTRIDVITLRYTKTTQEVGGEVISVEAASIAVIKGAEVSSGSTPEVPAINEGDIFNGDVIDDMALYHVLITDMTITSVTPVFVTMKSIELIDQKIGSTAMGTTAPTVTGAIAEIVNKIGSTSMGTSAWTVTGAIGEIADKLGSIAMGTSATTVTGAIKELVNKVGSTAMGTTATSVTGAIKELVNKIGTTAMGTTATTLTGAIKELKTAFTNLQTHDNGQAITLVPASLGSIAVQSSGGVEKIVNVASSIPSGYTLVDVIPAQTGSYAVYFYTCRKYNSTQVWVQLFRAANYYTSVTSVNPTVLLVCKKNL